MKKLFFFLTAVAVLASCHRNPQTITVFEPYPLETEDFAELRFDTYTFDTVYRHLSGEAAQWGEDPSFKVELAIPDAQQAPLLANAYAEWLVENLFDSYRGDMFSVDAMVHSKLEEMLKESTDEDGGNSLMVSVEKVYETPFMVSFECNAYYDCTGSAHGTPSLFGVTFRKTDGKVFGWNMLHGSRLDEDVLQQGLMEYFEVKSPQTLADCLLDPSEVHFMPMPSSAPWVTEKGVQFIYQPYEIASFNSGMPTFVVPVEKIKDQLTPVAEGLFNR